jgi:hypothetical protein
MSLEFLSTHPGIGPQYECGQAMPISIDCIGNRNPFILASLPDGFMKLVDSKAPYPERSSILA